MSVLHSLFQHKSWINAQTLEQAAKLDPETQKDARHLAIRILNHTYVVDRIFAAHLTGATHPYTAANTAETPSLDELRGAIERSDRWYVEYAGGVGPGELAGQIAFSFTDGDRGRMTREEMLMHVITHGTYHRGAVGRILTQAGVQPPRDIFTTFLHASEPARRESVKEAAR